MTANKLQDDLLQEFQEEKTMILSQIGLFEPMAAALRLPVARRLAAKGLLLISELTCWLLALAALGVGIFLNRLYPFYLLFQLNRKTLNGELGAGNVQSLQWAVYGLIGVAAVLFLLLARAMRRIRLKNDVLNVAGRNIKVLVGQHLARKAAIDAIEQRHYTAFPAGNLNATDPRNPAY